MQIHPIFTFWLIFLLMLLDWMGLFVVSISRHSLCRVRKWLKDWLHSQSKLKISPWMCSFCRRCIFERMAAMSQARIPGNERVLTWLGWDTATPGRQRALGLIANCREGLMRWTIAVQLLPHATRWISASRRQAAVDTWTTATHGSLSVPSLNAIIRHCSVK